MIVAIASGKGGVGKTMLAVNLARVAPEPVQLLDCDAEEPNCHLFVAGETVLREDVTLAVPVVDLARCTACGSCGEACQFGGIVVLPTGAHVFPTLCHGCGACVRACGHGALQEVPRRIGELTVKEAGALTLVSGRLDVGEALAPPVVRAVRTRADGSPIVIVDAPPGTSCPVVAAVRGADVAILVTEPTPFGLNDLELAVTAIRRLGLPFGVVINRAGTGDTHVAEYCAKEGVPVLMEIPHERRIAEAYARGLPLIAASPELRPGFLALLERVAKLARPRPGREA